MINLHPHSAMLRLFICSTPVLSHNYTLVYLSNIVYMMQDNVPSEVIERFSVQYVLMANTN